MALILIVLSVGGLASGLKLGVLQTNGNESDMCRLAINMAIQSGHCTDQSIDLLYRDGCVPDNSAMGTINAASLYFNEAVNGLIGPSCIDESVEIGRLSYFWKRPMFSRQMANINMLNLELFPTVVEASLTSAAGLTTAIFEVFKAVDNPAQPTLNISILGPAARTGDYYPVAQAIKEYLELNPLVPVGAYGLFDERDNIPGGLRRRIFQNGSKFLVAGMDFFEPHLMSHSKLSEFKNNGYLVVVVSTEPVEAMGEKEKQHIFDANALVIAPNIVSFANISGELNTMDKDNILGSFGNKFSMFLSCYGYCYGSKYGTTSDTQDYYTVFKNKEITNSLGTFKFDAGATVLTTYTVYRLTNQYDDFEVVMNVIPTTKSSCDGVACFSVMSEWVFTDNAYWEGLKAIRKKECTYDDTCEGNIVLIVVFSVVGILTLAVIILALCQYRRRLKLDMYRMHWKIKRDELKIIENKQSSLKGAKAPGGDTLATKRRVITAYAIVGSLKLDMLRMRQCGKIAFTRPELRYLLELKTLTHDNITKFFGICYTESDFLEFYVLHTLIERASLDDFVKDPDFNFDTTFRSAFIRDILNGLKFLHKSFLGYHGMLTTQNCLIDANWVLKLTNFGINTLLNAQLDLKTIAPAEPIPLQFYAAFAPELLQDVELTTAYPRASKGGDIYCFGIILHQILFRCGPFDSYALNPRELVNQIITKRLRPDVANTDEDPLVEMMQQCWFNADQRPTIRKVSKVIANAFSTSKGQLVDQMLMMSEKYAANLEKTVAERSSLLQEAQEQTMRLLNELLPKSVAAVLKSGGTVPPRSYDLATVLFVQVCDFQVLVARSSPEEVIQFLNDIYNTFDTIIDKYDAYKVETTGETYMVASGVPNENDGRHITEIAEISLDIREAAYKYKVNHCPDFIIRVKIGFHCGPIAAGVIGIRSPRYCLFGDTVNFSSRMQSNCPPNQIQTSEVTAKMLIAASSEYKLVQRGIVSVKGKGEVNCYWLNEHIHEQLPPPRTANTGRQSKLKTPEDPNPLISVTTS